MQNTHINKIISIFILSFLLISISGCRPKIPEGAIKDFVEQFDFNKTFEEIKYATSIIKNEHYQDGKLLGSIETLTYIDLQEGKYHYSKTTLTGSYHGIGEDKFDYYYKETISYLDENGNAIAYELTDGVINEMKYRPEDIDVLINTFYYTDNQYNYHKGGVYYGDYILANCAKNYQFFSLNEDKTELNYNCNTLYTSKENKKIIIMHSFTVNNLGMVLKLSSESFEKDNEGTKSITTIECDYQNMMIKKYNFN